MNTTPIPTFPLWGKEVEKSSAEEIENFPSLSGGGIGLGVVLEISVNSVSSVANSL
jgi:hypothetical protein